MALITLEMEDGARLAVNQTPGAGPTVVFLGGFMSDMEGTKALDLEAACRAHGRAYVRFDYFGHGASSGRFEEGTIGRWCADALAVIDRLITGPVILVGSSMGGWLMVLVARARPDRVRRLVGVASAPDFTEELFFAQLSAGQRQTLNEEGVLYRPNAFGAPYPFTKTLIEEARAHLVLGAPISLACPVRLLHGMSDADVPYEFSIKLGQALAGRDVRVTLIKGGDHRLSQPEDLALLRRMVFEETA